MTPATRAKMLGQIKLHEGLSLKAYRDTKGWWTVGYGHNMDADTTMTSSRRASIFAKGITRAEAHAFLSDDVEHATRTLSKALPWANTLDEVRQAVMVELTFNMGIGFPPHVNPAFPKGKGLLSFLNTLAFVRQGRYAEAAEGLRHSKWYRDVKSGRGDRIAGEMETGRWPVPVDSETPRNEAAPDKGEEAAGMGRQVWLSPNVASGDLLRMFQAPEEWAEARRYIDVLSLVQWSITHAANPKSGPNTAAGFLSCVPGGAFRWLAEHDIKLSLEGSAVKEWSCGDDRVKAVAGMMESLDIIAESGGRVDYIVMDEPFVAGLATPPAGCAYTVEQTAHETRLFVDAIHERYPHIKIGLVEAYPAHQDEEIVRFVTALQAAGCALPFVHVDVDLYRVRREKREKEARVDLKRLQTFCASIGIRYGVVTWGERGTSNEEFCQDARALAAFINESIGFASQDNIVFQSWSADQPNMVGLQRLPDNLPGTSRVSHTGLLTSTLQLYGVEPPKEEH